MARAPSKPKKTTKTDKHNALGDFEASLTTLEGLVERMESGELSLEEALKAFEDGVALARNCQTALSEAEQKVNLLLAQNEEPEWEALDEAIDDDE